MKVSLNQQRLAITFASLISFPCFSTPCDSASTDITASPIEKPSQYIKFASVLDGRCQNLSSGGKLRIVKNTHHDKTIKYRFVRMFAGRPQAGITKGILEPGEKVVKLGCTKVDGREQTWEIQILNFVEK